MAKGRKPVSKLPLISPAIPRKALAFMVAATLREQGFSKTGVKKVSPEIAERVAASVLRGLAGSKVKAAKEKAQGIHPFVVVALSHLPQVGRPVKN